MAKKAIKVHGGARKGAGRKPVEDPKVPITIYVKESLINSLGGIDSLREELYKQVSNMK